MHLLNILQFTRQPPPQRRRMGRVGRRKEEDKEREENYMSANVSKDKVDGVKKFQTREIKH